jgi:hypothetical protein
MWQTLSRSLKQQCLNSLRLFYTSRYAGSTDGKKDENISASVQKVHENSLKSRSNIDEKDRTENATSSTPESSASKMFDKPESSNPSSKPRISLSGKFKSYEDIFFLIGISLPINVISYFDGFANKMGIEVLFEMVIAGLSNQSIDHLIELNKLPYDCFKGLVNEANKQWLENPRPYPVFEPHMLDMFVDTFDNTVKKVYASVKSDQSKKCSSDNGNEKSAEINLEKSRESEPKIFVDTKSGSIKSISPEKIWPQIEKDVVKAIDDNISTKIQKLLEISDSEKKMSSQIDELKKDLHKVSSVVGSFKAAKFVKNKQLESTINTLTETLKQDIATIIQKSKSYSNERFAVIETQFYDETNNIKKNTVMAVQNAVNSLKQKINIEMKELEDKHARDIKNFETRVLKIEPAYRSLRDDLIFLQNKLESLPSLNKTKDFKADFKAIASKTNQYVTKKELETAIKPLIQKKEAQKAAKVLTLGEYIIIDSSQNKILTSTMPAEMCKQNAVEVLAGLNNAKRFNRTIGKLSKKGFEIVGGTEDSVFMRRTLKTSRRQRRMATLKWLLLIFGGAVAGELWNESYIGKGKTDDDAEKNKSTLERLVGPLYTYPR